MNFINLKKIFKVFFINILLIYFFLYFFEILINFNKDQLFQKTRLYFLNKKIEKDSSKIYLNFGSYKLIDKKNIKDLPLSGYDQAKILLCMDENNKPVYYDSDLNGFNNEIFQKYNDILLIGDSYVQGMCVKNSDNFNGQFKKFNLKTTSLGVAGNGPLLEYSTFKEYESIYEFKKLILFITPDNDFYDLSNEINNRILLEYLTNQNFVQNLSNNEKKKKKEKLLNEYFGNKTQRFANDFLSIYHFNLKEVGNVFENLFSKKKETTYFYLQNEKVDKTFFEIIYNFNNYLNKQDIDFYIVFNSVTPNILYPSNSESKKFKKLLDTKVLKIKKLLDKNQIKYLDYSEYLSKNYDNENINLIFKRINNKWDHYTEKGYFILTKKIVELISNKT
jgi:hypothetical protein